MALIELSHGKKTNIYSRLIVTGLLEQLTLSDTSRLGATKDDIIRDIETNYPALLQLRSVDEDISNKDMSIEANNKVPGNFKWTNENIPVINPEYYVYDNSTDAKWDVLAVTNSYPGAMDNLSCTVRSGDDDFTTYNNRTFADYFQHVQGSIRPKKNQTMDAWYDVGLKAVMFNNGIPYSSPNFQKAFYVWYIKGDGTDYPYLNQVAHTYPGQEVNFKYKYETMKGVIIKSASIIKVNGETPGFRSGQAATGFFGTLSKPNTYTNCIVKSDLGLLELVGQRWHYQGFTIKAYPIFSVLPGKIDLEMRGDLVELDITNLIDTSLTWELDNFEITSSDPTICTVEHDWTGREDDPKYIIGPSYIKLIGNKSILDETVTFTVTATAKDSNYIEQFTFDVRVKQLYNKDTYLEVDPGNLVVMVGKETEYNVYTDAASYNVSTNNTSLIRLYKGKIAGLKQGTGILTFTAQASMSMPATVNVPFTVNKYIPEPIINTELLNLNLEVNETKMLSFTTNCPRVNIGVTSINTNVARVDEIVWEDRTTQDDKLTTEYVTRYGAIPIRGITEGLTEIRITGFIANGEVNIEKRITIVVSPETKVDDTPSDELDDGQVAVMTKADAYLSFHHQAQGVFTYLRSKGRVDLSEQEIQVMYDNFKANKIFAMPEVSEEDIELFKTKDFTLALVEDVTKNDAMIAQNNNPNYIDYKETYPPKWGNMGNTLKDNLVWVNSSTLEVFINKTMDGRTAWIGNRGYMVNDIEYPFPGEKGFGVGPAPHDISLYYGMRPLPGCWDRNNDNYGNYLDPFGSVMVYIPRHYLRYVKVDKNDIPFLHHIEVWYPPVLSSLNYADVSIPTTTVTDNELRGRDGVVRKGDDGYQELVNTLIMPRCFVNNGKLLPGIFVDKYQMNNKMYVNGSVRGLNLSNKNLPKPTSRMKFKYQLPYHNNSMTYAKDQFDNIWLNVLSNKDRVAINYTGTQSTKRTRFNTDTSFYTIFARNMVNNLAIAHGSGAMLYNSVDNCDWLNSDGSMPKGVINTDTKLNYYTDLTEEFNKNINYTLPINNHNGQANGIAGLNNGNLELCIGAALVLTATKNGTLEYKLDLEVSNMATDFRTVTKTFISNSNSDDIDGTTLFSYNLKFSNLKDISIPNETIQKGFYSTSTDSKKKPLMLKNTYNPIDSLSLMYNNIVSANINNINSLESTLYNIGMWGYYLENNNAPERYDYHVLNYNNDCNLAWNMRSINIGDNRTGFFISNKSKPGDDEANGFNYKLLPMYGGVLNYELDEEGNIKLSNQHFMSMTWYRVGYNLSELGDDVGIKIGTRLTILPDMEKIKNWFDSGGYDEEFQRELEEFGDVSGTPGIFGKVNDKANENKNGYDPYEDPDNYKEQEDNRPEYDEKYQGTEYPEKKNDEEDDNLSDSTIVLNAILRNGNEY